MCNLAITQNIILFYFTATKKRKEKLKHQQRKHQSKNIFIETYHTNYFYSLKEKKKKEDIYHQLEHSLIT